VKVLFLDIDGVLNGHEWDDEAKSCNIRRECVKHLNRVVRETGCRIVLSSAWRYMIHGGAMTLTGFAYMLRTHGLTGATRLIIGLTRKDDESVDPIDRKLDERARQIKDWLEWWNEDAQIRASVGLDNATRFVAVDDEDHGFAAHGIPAVITDGGKGMTDADADRVIAMFQAIGGDACPSK
jgi:hypothetical protein